MPDPIQTSAALTPDLRTARRWLGLAIVVLVLAGVYALAVVIGRTPPFDRYVSDPLFFKRCLVAHVNLALVTWFYAFLAALLSLLPGRGTRLSRYSVHISSAGVGLLLVGTLLSDSRPILSNYIPTIDNPIFQSGQAIFLLGVLASLFDRRMLPDRGSDEHSDLPAAARTGVRAAAIAFGLAVVTLGVSWAGQPAGLAPDVHYERLAWGGGHVLQLVCTTAMISVWLMLLTPVLGRSPVSSRAAPALFLALLLPWVTAPLLAAQGTDSLAYREGFTGLMRWCIFPVVAVFLILCLDGLRQAWREGRIDARSLKDPRISGFAVSACLTLLGVGLGAAIRGSNTMVPAHYHASVGGVTVSFMAAAYVLLHRFGVPMSSTALRRASAWQPLLYGGGMLLFAAGFAQAGAYGMGRKVYGAEQAARGLPETIGLAVMGLGGFIAIAGGILFLGIVATVWWRGTTQRRQPEKELVESSWRWRHGTQ